MCLSLLQESTSPAQIIIWYLCLNTVIYQPRLDFSHKFWKLLGRVPEKYLVRGDRGEVDKIRTLKIRKCGQFTNVFLKEGDTLEAIYDVYIKYWTLCIKYNIFGLLCSIHSKYVYICISCYIHIVSITHWTLISLWGEPTGVSSE